MEEKEEGYLAMEGWDATLGSNPTAPEGTTAAVIAIRRKLRVEAAARRATSEKRRLQASCTLEETQPDPSDLHPLGVDRYNVTRIVRERGNAERQTPAPSLVEVDEVADGSFIVTKMPPNATSQQGSKKRPVTVDPTKAPTGGMTIQELDGLDLGGRGLDAIIRPYPVFTPGDPDRVSFSIAERTFHFSYTHALPPPIARDFDSSDASHLMVAEIFMPRWQYPDKRELDVRVSAGEWRWTEEREPDEEADIISWDYMVPDWKAKGGAPRFRCSGGGVRKIVWKCGCWDGALVGARVGKVKHEMVVKVKESEEIDDGRIGCC
ncbi:hypothetical protein HDU93_003453 [Gonapodya sp. JEL0774]|nr:hypothetical protein HDU93_003453 [Gonapodya sp. JEL0774]